MNTLYFSTNSRIILARVVFALLVAALFVSASGWGGFAPVLAHSMSLMGWVFIAIGVTGRVWSGSYICGRKTSQLITHGPYSICRNPLYLFSFAGGLGVMLVTERLLFPCIFTVLFLVYHTQIIAREERKLRAQHGEAYAEYCSKVPRFWPNIGLFSEPREYTIDAADFREHLSEVMWFIVAGGLIEFLEALRASGYLPTYLYLY
ncbi:MAG: isoprenylcysteine carboxylmethyltransferase family protein [Gammaproteobacteria bacterium]|nr:isoprenylcysteine carboxylmethyltransferase family protein [Gammaproteobacteria bacterium]